MRKYRCYGCKKEIELMNELTPDSVKCSKCSIEMQMVEMTKDKSTKLKRGRKHGRNKKVL